MRFRSAWLLAGLELIAAEATLGSLRVGFVGDDLSQASAYMRGFDFWVSYVNNHTESSRGGFALEGRAYRIEAVRALFNESADQAWVQNFAQGWAMQNIWMVILAVPLSLAQEYSNSFSSLGINHINVVTESGVWSQRLANRGLFGIQPPRDSGANGFVSLVAPASRRGFCTLTSRGAPGTGLMSTILMQATHRGMPQILGVDFQDSGQLEETRAFMRNYSEDVVKSGCDVLVASVEGAAAAALQESLANVSAPLVAELILPKPDGSVWGPLGKLGEHVFTSTPWHHSMHHHCRVFGDTSSFVTAFRQWHLETFQIDRLPSAEEALAAAGATAFQVAAKVRKFFPPDERFQHPEFWQELAAEVAAQDFGGSPVGVEEGSNESEVADDLPYLFPHRMRKSLEDLKKPLFVGDVTFDSIGMRSSGDLITVQYFEDGEERAARPLAVTQGVCVVPMDSFESRFGCRPGTVKHLQEHQEGTTDVLGAACVLCSGALEYQDERGQMACKQCPLGYTPSESRTACVPCGPGTYRGAEEEACRRCPKGEFSNASGSEACQPCPPGEFAEDCGQAACKPCPAGSISPQEGARSCLPCNPGYSTEDQSGATQCIPCVRGFYSEGTHSMNCTACPESFGTAALATDSRLKCVCPPGSYWYRDGPEAEPLCSTQHCDDSLICEGWNNDPPLAARHYSGGPELFAGAGPAYIVRCASREDCPGRLPLGTCPATRANVPGCGICEEGYSKHFNDCVPCSETPYYVPALLLLAALLLVVAIIYGAHCREYSVDSKAMIKILAAAGIAIPALQILVVFRFIEIDWPDPVATIHTLYAAVLEPMKLMNLECIFSVTKAWQAYLSVVMLWPVIASLLLVVLVIPRWLPAPLTRTIGSKQIFQSEGLLVLTLYTSISMLSLVPWQCKGNPDGTWSVVAHREVLCWDSDEHIAMLAMSTFDILIFIVGFMSLVAWATYQYPISVQGPHGLRFLTRFGWIFNRYKSEKYYYGLAYCARNLLVTLVPVIFAGNIPLQLLLVACMLLFSLVLQCWVQPWRTTLSNKLDAACCVLLILTLVAACVLLDLDPSNMRCVVSTFFSITWGVLALGIAVVLCQNAYFWWRPRRKYTFFLCHHKQGAAMLARWVKIQLKLRQPGRVFLDSDMLHRIDALFEVVGHQTKNLVVLLTKETLSRIWCAGEVATAMQCRVNIILIACNDYEEPDDEFIDKLGDLWSPTQLLEVAQQGVGLHEIKEAYNKIREMPKIILDRTADIQEQTKAIEKVLSQAVSCRMWKMGGVLPSNAKGFPAMHLPEYVLARSRTLGNEPRVLRGRALTVERSVTPLMARSYTRVANLVVGNLADPEAAVVCRVVQLLLQQHLHTAIQVASVDLDEAIAQLNHLEQPAHVAVVLTRGVLECPAFAAFLAKAVQQNGVTCPSFAPIVADYYFAIPDAKFYRDLEQGHIIKAEEVEPHGVFLMDISRAYKHLLRTITRRFSAEGSENVQHAEIQEIAALFRSSETPNSMDASPANSSIWGVAQRWSRHSSSPLHGKEKDVTPTASTCSDSGQSTRMGRVSTMMGRSSSKKREPEVQLSPSSCSDLDVLRSSKSDWGDLSELETAMPPTQEPHACILPITVCRENQD